MPAGTFAIPCWRTLSAIPIGDAAVRQLLRSRHIAAIALCPPLGGLGAETWEKVVVLAMHDQCAQRLVATYGLQIVGDNSGGARRDAPYPDGAAQNSSGDVRDAAAVGMAG